MKSNELYKLLQTVLPAKELNACSAVLRRMSDQSEKKLIYIIKYFRDTNIDVLRIFVDALDKDSLRILSKYISYSHDSRHFVKRMQKRINDKIYPQKDLTLESTARLLALFLDKKSGRVIDARNELLRRYEYLSRQDYKKMISALLRGTKTDRSVAYKCLLRRWDDSFLSEIQMLWEKYHEERCKWLVLKYFPTEYIWLHLKELDDGTTNYIYICQRLANYPQFVLDRERLEEEGRGEYPYLYVMATAGAKMDGREALEILFFHIAQEVSNVRKNANLRRFKFYPDYSISRLGDVNRILYYMGKCGLYDELLFFAEWDRRVNAVYEKMEQEKNHRNEYVSWYEYCMIIKQEFPSEICTFEVVAGDSLYWDEDAEEKWAEIFGE